MKLMIALSAAAVVVSLFALRARAGLSEAEARAHLQRGALVVDVRTAEEFNTKRLTNTVNIPLAELQKKFPSVVPNPSTVVLLHCQSGARSGAAERQLRALGYTNVFNIGSFSQAEKILRPATP